MAVPDLALRAGLALALVAVPDRALAAALGAALALSFAAVPDLEVLQPLLVHLVQEEVWQFLSELVKAVEQTLHWAELELGFFRAGVLSVLSVLRRQWHKLLQKRPSQHSRHRSSQHGCHRRSRGYYGDVPSTVLIYDSLFCT